MSTVIIEDLQSLNAAIIEDRHSLSAFIIGVHKVLIKGLVGPVVDPSKKGK